MAGVSIHAPAGGATERTPPPRSGAKFQFTLPRGERRLLQRLRLDGRRFQFTLPRGERPPVRPARPDRRGFNSRSRGGSDTARPQAHRPTEGFNSRSRGGSDRPRPPRGSTAPMFQFTLPRGERRAPFGGSLGVMVVSSHAPAGGATRTKLTEGGQKAVSIHAPAGGATQDQRGPRQCQGSFNSRSRGGSDGGLPRRSAMLGVSIHAPAGGATGLGGPQFALRRFQFTLPRGERQG